MVRFVKDQPDAYIYSSFGARIFIGGLLMSLLYITIGIIVYMYADIILSWYTKLFGIPDIPIIGPLMDSILFVTVMFLPLVSITVVISRFILRRTYKKLEQLEIDSKTPQFLLSLARFFFIGCAIATFAPLAMVAESAMNMEIPSSSISYFQSSFMAIFFTLLGIQLFLTMISPVVQLYGRTKSRGLLLAGFLAFIVSSSLIYMANGQWNISIFNLATSEFKSSFGTVMIICGICIFLCFWLVSKDAKSILRYQKMHFTMKLGE